MVQSLNTKINLVVKGTAFMGILNYGNIMIGDKAFEFYNHRDNREYVQIPWTEVDYVIASVLFGGRWIPRYSIKTKSGAMFTFSSKEPKKVLRTIRLYVEGTKIVRSLGLWEAIKRRFRFKRNK